MINLKIRLGNPKFFESSVINHPQQTGTSYVEYSVTHGFNELPEFTKMYRQGGDGQWR